MEVEQVIAPIFGTTREDFASAGLPLRKFTGRLTEIIPEFGGQRKYIQLPHTEVTVEEADPGVVWHHPIAELELGIFFGNDGRQRSFGQWYEAFQSAEALGYPDFRQLVGKMVTWKATMREFESRSQQCAGAVKVPVEGVCPDCGKEGLVGPTPHGQKGYSKDWHVTAVGGEAGGSNGAVSEDDLLALLESPHNATQFAQAVMAKPALKAKYGNQSLYDGELLAGLVSEGKVRMEGDTYVRA